jgi:ABC-type phosphate/phosphonate transport system substrate-binding protein
MMMKKLVLVALTIAISFGLSCEHKESSKNVPEAVKTAFNKKFTNAEGVEWSQEDDSEWEAEFKIKGINYSANFTNKGEWKETEYKIKRSELPEAVRATISQEFNEFDVESAEISETADGEVYELVIEIDDEEFEVVIDANGKIIEKKKSSEEDDDDEDGEDEHDN